MWDGTFPKKYNGKKKQHIATAHDQEEMYYDKEGNVKHKSSQHMLSTQKGKQELVIEFRCSKNLDSMDKKITMKIDTGADVNAINRKMFKTLFPDVQLQQSTVVLQNFDSSYIQLMGRFKAFLCWKGQKYRIDVEVMVLIHTRKMGIIFLVSFLHSTLDRHVNKLCLQIHVYSFFIF